RANQCGSELGHRPMADLEAGSARGRFGSGPVTRLEPPTTETTAPFWDATRERRFLLQWCTACEAPVFYPRDVCPRCLGTALDWREASGRGTVYAVSVQHRAANPTMSERVPYAVALVDLEEGVRIMSN